MSPHQSDALSGVLHRDTDGRPMSLHGPEAVRHAAESARRRRRSTAAVLAAVTAVAVAAGTIAFTGPDRSSAPPPPATSTSSPVPVQVAAGRFLHLSDFIFGEWQAAEDPGSRQGHPVCAGLPDDIAGTLQWREFRTFDQDIRAYQVVAPAGGGAVATSLLDQCRWDGSAVSTLVSEDPASIHGSWRVHRIPGKPDRSEVSAAAAVGGLTTAFWLRGLHPRLTTDGYAEYLLDSVSARLDERPVRPDTAPDADALSAALLTAPEAGRLSGTTIRASTYPRTFQQLNICAPALRGVTDWRQVLHDSATPSGTGTVVTERISLAQHSDGAAETWRRLVADATSCDVGDKSPVIVKDAADDAVLLSGDTATPAVKDTAIVRLGRIVVELSLHQSPSGADAPTESELLAAVGAALQRIGDVLPTEASGSSPSTPTQDPSSTVPPLALQDMLAVTGGSQSLDDITSSDSESYQSLHRCDTDVGGDAVWSRRIRATPDTEVAAQRVLDVLHPGGGINAYLGTIQALNNCSEATPLDAPRIGDRSAFFRVANEGDKSRDTVVGVMQVGVVVTVVVRYSFADETASLKAATAFARSARAQIRSVQVGDGRSAVVTERETITMIRAMAAKGAGRQSPGLSPQVLLGLAGGLVTQVARKDLEDPNGWLIDSEGYQERTGPFSPLTAMASALGQFTIVSGSHRRWDSSPVAATAGLAGLRHVSAQPTNVDSCIDWWSVDVFVDDNDQIRGVTLDLGST